MANLLIRNVPGDTIQMAKELAQKHRHSLQEELSVILVEAVRFHAGKWSVSADKIRKRLSGKGRSYSDSAKLAREDRER